MSLQIRQVYALHISFALSPCTRSVHARLACPYVRECVSVISWVRSYVCSFVFQHTRAHPTSSSLSTSLLSRFILLFRARIVWGKFQLFFGSALDKSSTGTSWNQKKNLKVKVLKKFKQFKSKRSWERLELNNIPWIKIQ